MEVKKIVLCLFVFIAFGCSDNKSGDQLSNYKAGKLIGGVEETSKDAFPSTIMIRGNCTASKVGQKLFLTAAHCMVNFASGNATYPFQMGGMIQVRTHYNKVWKSLTIDKVFISSPYVKEMKRRIAESDGASFEAGFYASDVGLFRVKENTPNISKGIVSFEPILDNEQVVIVGYGCEKSLNDIFDYSKSRFKTQRVKTIGEDNIYHQFQDESVYVYSVNFITEGIKKNLNSASLCPGDSGGPVYYKNSKGENVIVGVNSFYTFVDGSGISLTNLHTRFDNIEIESWLKGVILTN